MIRINTAAIIQSALALVVAITIADTIRESIRWLSGGDTGLSGLGIRIAITVLLIFAAIIVLGQCGDHPFSMCAVDEPAASENYLSNKPVQTMICGKSDQYEGFPRMRSCDIHPDGHRVWCHACMLVES